MLEERLRVEIRELKEERDKMRKGLIRKDDRINRLENEKMGVRRCLARLLI